jgi:hypothetical protein
VTNCQWLAEHWKIVEAIPPSEGMFEDRWFVSHLPSFIISVDWTGLAISTVAGGYDTWLDGGSRLNAHTAIYVL